MTMDYRQALAEAVNGWRRSEWYRLGPRKRKQMPEPKSDDPVSDDIIRCAWVLVHTYHGEHHVPRCVIDTWMIEVIHDRGPLATYDFDEMTRMVVLAHDAGVRIQVGPRGVRSLSIMLHPRTRSKSISAGHPTLEERMKSLREHWAPCPVLVPQGSE